MPTIKFNPEISVTSLITILTLVVSVVGGWTLLSASVNASAARIDTLERKFEEAATTALAQREAAVAAQLDLTRTLTELQTDVRYLREAVDALVKQRTVTAP